MHDKLELDITTEPGDSLAIHCIIQINNANYHPDHSSFKKYTCIHTMSCSIRNFRGLGLALRVYIFRPSSNLVHSNSKIRNSNWSNGDRSIRGGHIGLPYILLPSICMTGIVATTLLALHLLNYTACLLGLFYTALHLIRILLFV